LRISSTKNLVNESLSIQPDEASFTSKTIILEINARLCSGWANAGQVMIEMKKVEITSMAINRLHIITPVMFIGGYT